MINNKNENKKKTLLKNNTLSNLSGRLVAATSVTFSNAVTPSSSVRN